MCNLMQTTTAASSASRESSLLVRPANLLDCEPIAAIYNQYVGSGPYTMEEERWTWLTVKHQLDHITDREVVIVCENGDGEVVGWGKVKHYSPRGGYRIACETSTYVSRDARGLGVGNRLLSELVALSRRLGYHHITAKIIAGNGPSLRLHFKHGFELVGVQKEIGLVDGKLADVAILQRVN
jgi:phosphinothricin acetyltransferase